jgi:hypothetical protein
MISWALPFSIVLGLFIVLVEATRKRVEQIDFLLPVSCLVFICFVFVPFILPAYRYDSLGAWGWLFERNLDGWAHAGSVLLATFLYAIVAWTYLRVPKNLGQTFARWAGPISHARLAVIGLVFLAIAVVAVAVFVQERGDIVVAITEAVVFKTSEIPLGDLVFTIKLSPFATLASFVFWHLYSESGGFLKGLAYGCLLVVSILVALLGLFFLGGRVSFMIFVLTFVLGEVIYRRWRLRIGGLVLLLITFVVPVVLFGKVFLRAFGDEGVLESAFDDFVEAPSDALRLFVFEFSFPWVNVANFLVLSPDPIPFRWFVDIPLGVVSLLPKLLLGLEVPPSITELYDRAIDAPMPVDLTSFGYVSGGIGGLAIVAAGYGLILRIAEDVFGGQRSRLWALLRAAWILVLGSQVMYGSPLHFFVAAFTLIAGTGLLMLASSRSLAVSPLGSGLASART